VFGRERVLLIPSAELFQDAHTPYASSLEFLGLPPHEARYDVHNARSYSKVDPTLERWLVEQFAESNAQLLDMLGPRFDFGRG